MESTHTCVCVHTKGKVWWTMSSTPICTLLPSHRLYSRLWASRRLFGQEQKYGRCGQCAERSIWVQPGALGSGQTASFHIDGGNNTKRGAWTGGQEKKHNLPSPSLHVHLCTDLQAVWKRVWEFLIAPLMFNNSVKFNGALCGQTYSSVVALHQIVVQLTTDTKSC